MKKVSYSIQGWTDKLTWADFSKDIKSKIKAKSIFNQMLHSGKYEMIVLREEVDYGYCSISTGIERYEDGKHCVYKNKEWKEKCSLA